MEGWPNAISVRSRSLYQLEYALFRIVLPFDKHGFVWKFAAARVDRDSDGMSITGGMLHESLYHLPLKHKFRCGLHPAKDLGHSLKIGMGQKAQIMKMANRQFGLLRQLV